MINILNKLRDFIKPLMQSRAVCHNYYRLQLIATPFILFITFECFQMWDSNANIVEALKFIVQAVSYFDTYLTVLLLKSEYFLRNNKKW